MKLFERVCETLTRALSLSVLALPSTHGKTSQQPMHEALGQLGTMNDMEASLSVKGASRHRLQHHDDPDLPEGPIFKPPNSSENFTCDYRKMRGWKHTAVAGARTQWLETANSRQYPNGGVFDIWTDYDAFWPTGTIRKVCEPLIIGVIQAYGPC